MKKDYIMLVVTVVLMGVFVAVSKYDVLNTPQTHVLLPRHIEGLSEELTFSEGLAPMRIANSINGETSKWGYVDQDGKIVIKPQFDHAYKFSDGLARVEMNGKYSFVDKTGKTVINLQFDLVNDFSEGLASVVINDKCGYIDTKGKIVIEPQFKAAADFSNGEALVLIDEELAYIDKKGNIIRYE